jgi:hypothetical protein
MNLKTKRAIGFLILSWVIPSLGHAVITNECKQAANWGICKHQWERVGLTPERFKLMMDMATDAYLPHDQAAYGQKIDLTQSLIVDGEVIRAPRHDFSLKHKNAKPNSIVFSGMTGTYGFRSYTPMGFVYYEPSDFEKAITANPNLVKKLGISRLLKEHSTRRLIVVAFRGTRHLGYDLLMTDGSTRKKLAPGADGFSKDTSFFAGIFQDIPKVHGGFLATFQSSFPEIERAIKTFMYDRLADLSDGLDHAAFDQIMRDTEVVITGHSLGGALAQIAGYVIGQRPDLSPSKPTVYTFSQPKVGNKPFVEHMDALGVQVIRIYRTSDIVPMVPGILPLPGLMYFEHTGEELQVNDLSQMGNLWAAARVMPRHSIEKLNAEMKAIVSDIMEGVSEGIASLSDGIVDLLDDFEVLDDEFSKGGVTDVSAPPNLVNVQSSEELSKLSNWKRFQKFFSF